MEHVDEITRHKIREWQMRRLEIKDQMIAHPERVLELSRVLDQMEEEHERILEQATRPASVTIPDTRLQLQLQVSAKSVHDLRKLLELALHELDGVLDESPSGSTCPGGMSGSLGAYQFELLVGSESHGTKP
ncbi:hypothetical protein P5705_21440 [Pseudomonas entomophila]|uniref:hypothetical protein n=1 Tax=Pseudomonas entomophila TaxID=312306 RepID=UPI0024065553|nr:hypothetical protein [Pseudomonas entomophila]MDF9620220.1 hypothetical protein [Pseudomonas entomophila]